MSVVQRWLDSLTPNTRRNYRSTLAAFLCYRFNGPVFFEDESIEPYLRWEITQAQILEWLNGLQQDGVRPATLNVYRAALASFYRHARGVEGWQIADPLSGIRPHKLSPYGRSRFPTPGQVSQLLAAIPTDTVAGKRDLALILGLYVTTRRVNEWVSLRWHNVHRTIDGYWFAYIAKGGSEERQVIPTHLWQQIEAYLVAAERWPLSNNAPIFIRVGKRARHSIPLSAGYVRCAIAKYGADAGLPTDVCHPHGLRHAGARARKEAGQTPWDMQGILAHKNLATTMIYTRTVLDLPKDTLGDSIAQGVWPA